MIQFIKFGITGLCNSILNYIIYIACIRAGMHYISANAIGYVIVIFIAFLMQNYFVFRDEAGRKQNAWWKMLIKTYLSYAFTGLFLSSALSVFWLDIADISVWAGPFYQLAKNTFQWRDERAFAEYIVPFMNVIFTVPINFVLNKKWTYRNRQTEDRMKKKILFVSNYYAPYISGITEGERLLAEELARRGYIVKVITARHDSSLAKYEVIHGVEVERCSVQMKISKGTVSIPFIVKVIRESGKFDVVNMQLPMLESGLLSLFISRKKLVPMYHCDINLPKGAWNRMIVTAMDLSHRVCLKRSSRIWVTSIDYASHSRTAGRFRHKFLEAGVAVKKIRPGKYVRSGSYKIGFSGRIVEEKGIDVLVRAFAMLQKQGMDAQLLIGGNYSSVAGGSVYPALIDYIKKHKVGNVRFLGEIPEEKMGEFYSSLDVFVLPSINSMEAFGLVQVEAMLCGTPVVASDLYGVRTVVGKTGMGLACRAGSPDDLAGCIKEILEHREAYVKDPSVIDSVFSTDAFIGRIYNDINFKSESR